MKQALERLIHEQEALLKAEQKYRSIVENSPLGIFQVTPDGCFESANLALARLYGYDSPEELISSLTNIKYQLYVAPCRWTEFVELIQRYGSVSEFESMIYRRDGSIIWIHQQARAVYEPNGVLAYYQGFVEDITERKKAEAERIKLMNELILLNQEFSRFVPRQLLQLAYTHSLIDIELDDSIQQEMTVLVSDIHGFMTFLETTTHQDDFKCIDSSLSCLKPAILAHQGVIAQYTEDIVIALFRGCADDAIKAAVAILHKFSEYKRQYAASGVLLPQVGIGISTDSWMLEQVGEQNRLDSRVISDCVNLASRLKDLTNYYGVSLLVSYDTLASLHNPTKYNIRLIEQLKVNCANTVPIFEVFDGDEPEIKAGKLATKTIFESGLFFYQQQEFGKAARRFEEVLSVNPRDTVAQIYLKLSRAADLILLEINACKYP